MSRSIESELNSEENDPFDVNQYEGTGWADPCTLVVLEDGRIFLLEQ
jgi:hypothetical protein